MTDGRPKREPARPSKLGDVAPPNPLTSHHAPALSDVTTTPSHSPTPLQEGGDSELAEAIEHVGNIGEGLSKEDGDAINLVLARIRSLGEEVDRLIALPTAFYADQEARRQIANLGAAGMDWMHRAEALQSRLTKAEGALEAAFTQGWRAGTRDYTHAYSMKKFRRSSMGEG